MKSRAPRMAPRPMRLGCIVLPAPVGGALVTVAEADPVTALAVLLK